MSVAKFCRECGTPTEGAKFCPECGTPTAVETAAAAPFGGGTAAQPDEVLAPPPVELLPDEQEVWTGVPDSVLSPVAKRTTQYVITTERVKVSSGLVGRKAESLDLFRVKDIEVKKSLTQRARGKGDVRITSTDASTPMFTFESIPDPEAVAETLRRLVRDSRHRHGVTMHERM